MVPSFYHPSPSPSLHQCSNLKLLKATCTLYRERKEVEKRIMSSQLRIELGTSCAEGHAQIVVIFPELCLSFLPLFLFYSIVMLMQALTLMYF